MPKVFRRTYRDKRTRELRRTKVYYYRICRGGRERAVSTGTSNYNEARRIAGEAWRAEQVRGPGEAGRVTVARLVARYLEDRGRDVSPHHLQNVTSVLQALADELGPQSIERVTPDALQAFLARRTEGRTNATYNRQLQAVRTMFGWAIRRDWLTSNPASGDRLPNRREEERARGILTDDEIRRLLETVRKEYVVTCEPAPGSRKKRKYEHRHYFPRYLYYFIRMALYTGARRGELLRMRWRHIDWTTCGVSLPKTKGRRARTVYFHEEFAPELREYRHAQAADGQPAGDADFLFLYDGQPVQYPVRTFKTALRLAGIVSTADRRISIHSLRHTALSLLARVASAKTVQAIAGHQSIETTQRYMHETEEEKRRAVAQVKLG